MDEIARRNEIVKVMTTTELAPIAVSNEIAIQKGTKIPLSRVTALGTGLQPLASAVQQVVSKGQAVSGYYKVTIPAGTQLAQFKDGSGFLIMKYILQENNDREGPVQWSHTRLAEIMLGYAEVLNEVNGRPTDEAYKMVNDVRKRVGLPELSKTMNHDQFLEAVLRERALELGFEEVRWFDLVRRDRQSDFKKKLYGLRSRGNDLNNPTEFTFEKIDLGDHYWATNWDTKWYLAPIPQEEINKQYGMTQNPGW